MPETESSKIKNEELKADDVVKPDHLLKPDDIVITKTESRTGGPGGQSLEGCYFQPIKDSREYSFHDPTGKVLYPDVKNRQQFKIHLDGIKYHITSDFEDTSDPVEAKAKGDWKIPGAKDGDDEESGTFHAQAGGGGSVETVSSATA